MKKYFLTMTVAALVLVTACNKKDDKDIPPALTTIAASDISASSATLGGNITEAGTPAYTERGVCYSTATEPTTDDNKKAIAGSGTGEFSVSVSELSAATTYYVRAYAIHTTGTVYSNVISFATLAAPLELSTSAVTEFTDRTAVLGGNITNAGTPPYSARGVCYATTPQPTVDDNRTPIEGSGTGVFSVTISGLTANTTYYVRAYAIHASGTIYGNEVSFTTEEGAEAPPVLSTSVSNISVNSATMGGNIIDAGSPAYTERGVCYATTENPTTDNNKTQIAGTGTGAFSVNVDNLDGNTTYYVRTYAIQPSGTITYGDEISFETNSSFDVEMVFVEGGTFMMGSETNLYTNFNYPIHEVEISSFYIGKFEITQEQYEFLMDVIPSGNIPENLGSDLPVTRVSWFNAQDFIQKLNEYTGKNYRLPTEAEWEYAARGGNQSEGYTYSGSNVADNIAWHIGNSDGHLHTVGTKAPNELGIYDMSGNAYEWCNDWYGENYYSDSPLKDPQGPASHPNEGRMLRGGSYAHAADQFSNVACRLQLVQASVHDAIGFRVALDVE